MATAHRLFEAASRPAGDARKAFIDLECAGAPQLRAELESLLGASDSESAIGPVIARAAQDALGPGLKPGDRVGAFRLVRELALVQARLGHLDKALQLARRARRLRGPLADDPIAAARDDVVLADVHRLRGERDRAAALLREAHATYLASYGAAHSLTRGVAQQLAEMTGGVKASR